MKYILVWMVAIMTQQGPIAKEIKDPTEIQSEEACAEYGERMAPRMADWVRGRASAGWDFPVYVQYRCEADGKPA